MRRDLFRYPNRHPPPLPSLTPAGEDFPVDLFRFLSTCCRSLFGSRVLVMACEIYIDVGIKCANTSNIRNIHAAAIGGRLVEFYGQSRRAALARLLGAIPKCLPISDGRGY